MVVFTCNHCGESLQKPKVEKHYTFVCRTAKSLTCVDCLKDFHDEEFVAHTKCVTEDERYAAKGSLPNGIVKKGEVKQETWVEMVKSILDKEKDLHPPHRNLLNTISSYNNIPRKKAKFINFLKSSSGGRVNLNDVEAVWNIIEKYKTEQTEQNKAKETLKKNGTAEEKATKNKENEKKKRKAKNAGESEETPKKKCKTDEELKAVDEGGEKFSFKGKILEILTEKGTLSSSKLQKRVVSAYLKETGKLECSITDVIKKYNKKLKKLPNVEIVEGKVTLKAVAEA